MSIERLNDGPRQPTHSVENQLHHYERNPMYFHEKYAIKLAKLKEAIRECGAVVAEADKVDAIQTFDVGYEQGWMEAVGVLVSSAEERCRT